MECEVGRLAVSLNHRRKGIGERLMAALSAHARAHQIRRLRLATSRYNKAAIQLYTKSGWKHSGVEKGYGLTMSVWVKDLGD